MVSELRHRRRASESTDNDETRDAMVTVCARCGRDVDLLSAHICTDDDANNRQSFELSPLKASSSSAAPSAPGAAPLDDSATNEESDVDDPNTALLHKSDKRAMNHNFANPNFNTNDDREPAVRWSDAKGSRLNSTEDDTIIVRHDGTSLLERLDEDEDEHGAAADFTHRGHDLPIEDESAWRIFVQVVGPFFIAGCGMVAAGILLDIVQHWPVFTKVSEIFILVPALLGLKGNLEMTLASRLSTLANMGMMDSAAARNRVIASNLSLIQAQACVVALFASLFAITLAWIPRGEIDLGHALLLCASAMTTAALASLVLGLIMVGVILASRKYHINPDNVATPIAASLGDLTTLGVLALFGTIFLWCKETNVGWVNALVVLTFVFTTPGFMYLAATDTHTKVVLEEGWTPVLAAMMISSAGGFILKQAVRTFRGIAVFQPVINGVGGNLVAVQASRISTSLHMGPVRMGTLPGNVASSHYCNPVRAFFGKELDSRAARVLLAMTVPGHLAFNGLIVMFSAGHQSPFTPSFMFVYLLAAVLQIINTLTGAFLVPFRENYRNLKRFRNDSKEFSACLVDVGSKFTNRIALQRTVHVAILLFICQWMVPKMWQQHIDPDNSAIPYLTALGDLLGTALLAMAFATLAALKSEALDEAPSVAVNATTMA